ncbi:MAG: hypothetical protein P8X89_22840 [Reinekea sp.]
MLPKIWGEPMGAPAIFEQQIEIKLFHSAATDSGIYTTSVIMFASWFYYLWLAYKSSGLEHCYA